MKSHVSFWLLILLIPLVKAQENDQKVWDNMVLSGYISNMQTVTASNLLNNTLKYLAVNSVPDTLQPVVAPYLDGMDEFPWLKDNQLHNRLNYNWYINDHFTFTMQLRNRFSWGDQVLLGMQPLPNDNKKYFADGRNLSITQTDRRNYIFNAQIDRLWLQYTYNNLEVKVGRQRINWGQTFAFNPNDIFNTYSYFDFDYPEKPGTDAVKITYYTGMASFAELAAGIDTANRVTIGGLYRFNKWSYDIQLLAGYMNETDVVAGFGWSGYIKDASFRGEFSYYHPKNNFSDTSGVMVLSLGTDYSFTNSLFLQAEFLYNQFPKGVDSYSLLSLMSEQVDSKRLSITEFSYLVSASYTINPRLSASLSGLYYPEKDGFYTGPTFDFSLSDNAGVSLIGQVFSLKESTERLNMFMGFLRVKLNF